MSRKALIATALVVVLAALGIGYYMLSNPGADTAIAGGAKNPGFTLVAPTAPWAIPRRR